MNHNILLMKMEHYGIKGLALKWFSSYLECRKQCVRVGSSISCLCDVGSGVPHTQFAQSIWSVTFSLLCVRRLNWNCGAGLSYKLYNSSFYMVIIKNAVELWCRGGEWGFHAVHEILALFWVSFVCI